jgi:AAA domain
MLHGGHIGLGWAEVQVTIAQRALIEALLRAGVNVISDDTNLTGRAVGALTKIATDCGANVVIKDFREVPLEVCIERDAQRDEDSRVGEAAIRDMHRRYIARRPVTRE